MSTIHDALQHVVFGQNWPHYDAIIAKRATARTLDQLEHLAGMCPPIPCCSHCEKEQQTDGR